MRLRHLSLFFLAAPAAAQTTWHVPGDAATLQAGIDLASPGDTVLVGPGSWMPAAPLDFAGKAITFKSSDGALNTYLDGDKHRRLMVFDDFEGPGTVIEGFTFFDGRGDGNDVLAPDETRDGGAILMSNSASPTIKRCVFQGNQAAAGGPGSTGSKGTDATEAGDDGGKGGKGTVGGRGGHGGAIWITSGTPLIESCVFYQNQAGAGGSGGKGGKGGKGGPNGFLIFVGDGGKGGTGGTGGEGGSGGAIGSSSGYPLLVNCLFIGNTSGMGGKGGNGGTGGDGGDGLGSHEGDVGPVGDGANGGVGGEGGALFNASNRFRIVNCTFTQQTLGAGGAKGTGSSDGAAGALRDGVVLHSYQGGDVIENTIIWGNSTVQSQLGTKVAGSFVVRYCCTQSPYSGAGNISVNPLFADTTLGWVGYGLQAGSQCIDAGSTSALAGLPFSAANKDLTGHLRKIDDPQTANTGSGSPAVDIGAREYVPAAVVEPLVGCGTNTPGSLTVLSGSPQLGTSMLLGIDNPLGTQAPLSLAFLSLSFATQPLGPCGLVLPGFGFAGNGAPGEFLLNYTPGLLAWTKVAGLWAAPGQPVPISIAITSDPSALGLPFFVQGAILDQTPGTQVVLGLTEGLRMVHGL
ncbi:hypothetical protein [Engelhardtia mirabilis]|uniref:Uncharacterized protein n=1 Tax=Engelhardtia mirabilis TaxID=2528011 RepID=A0A518BFW4_9BACT|nr:hypothetical protein Pla133_09340 [Planctomycetes bacterium Pla133]QDV00194.1 hypothetical protein Pla86_09330 [Planctomycetes bacterium Pla86]